MNEIQDLKTCHTPLKTQWKDKYLARWFANINHQYVYPCSGHFHISSIYNSKTRNRARKWHRKLFGDCEDIDAY